MLPYSLVCSKMADLWMNSVEKRVDALEKRVFGDADKDAHFPRCIESMANVNTKLMAGVQNRGKFMTVLQRLNEIEHYMDPTYTDKLTLTEQAKGDILLAQEDWIKKMITDLDKMEQLKEIMDSEHLKVVPSLNAKFLELSKRHVTKQDQVAEFSTDVNELLMQYNNLVATLSKQFVLWDEGITSVEKDVLPKDKPY